MLGKVVKARSVPKFVREHLDDVVSETLKSLRKKECRTGRRLYYVRRRYEDVDFWKVYSLSASYSTTIHGKVYHGVMFASVSVSHSEVMG